MGRRFTSLSDEEFTRLFHDFRSTAYRLERMQKYDVSYERDEFGQFLAGENRGRFPGIDAWINDTVRPAVRAGKHLHRVHVVEEPLSDYVRFECAWAYEHTVAAGEDVRVAAVTKGQWPDWLPSHDYWLFDSSLLVVMHYEPDGAFCDAEVTDDPGQVARANYRRDQALAASVPYHQFAAHHMDHST